MMTQKTLPPRKSLEDNLADQEFREKCPLNLQINLWWNIICLEDNLANQEFREKCPLNLQINLWWNIILLN
jgi:hypothetical protein